MAKSGDWVTVRNVILKPGERAPQVPADTADTSLCQWVKGRLLQDAQLHQVVKVLTRTGRTVEGELVEVNPAYHHSFGAFIPELQLAQDSVRRAMWEDEA